MWTPVKTLDVKKKVKKKGTQPRFVSGFIERLV